MASNPPISYLTIAEARELDLHSYQVFDMIAASGEHKVSTPQDLHITNISGSGPIYNIRFNTTSGIGNTISVGDMYISADSDAEISWYRYDIISISSSSSTTVDAQIKYIKDSKGWGNASPSQIQLSSQVSYDVIYYTRAHLLCRRVNVDAALLMF